MLGRPQPDLALEESAHSLLREGEEEILVLRRGFSILTGMDTVPWVVPSADKGPLCPRNALQHLPRNL